MQLIGLCCAALVGLALGVVCRLEPQRLVVVVVLASLGALLAHRQRAWRTAAMVTCALALGALRASLASPGDAAEAALLQPYFGSPVRLRGVVAEPPVLSLSSSANSAHAATVRILLDAETVAPAGRDPPVEHTGSAAAGEQGGANSGAAQPAPQGPRVRVIADADAFSQVAAHDTLLVEGRLQAGHNPGDERAPPTMLFPRLLALEPSQTLVPAAVFHATRSAAEGGIRRYLPEPQASVATGVLLGGSRGLDADVRLQLQRSGLAHLVAIDGYKLVVVAAALGAITGRLLDARLAALVNLFAITSYTLLTGAHPSAVRAALMFGLATLARLTGRVADSLTSVLIAATVMAGIDPPILLDIGLQLSLSATLGIVLLWPRLRSALRPLPHFVAEPVGLTVAVTLSSLPVVLSTFQMVSLVSPVAHVVAVPLLPPVLGSAALLAAVSHGEMLGAPIGWLANVPTTLLLYTIQVFGNLPGAAISTGRLPGVAAGIMALGLVVWGLFELPEATRLRQGLARLSDKHAINPVSAPAACIFACLVAAGTLYLVRPDGRLHVQALDAGRGEAVLIRGPTGRLALVLSGKLNPVQLVSQVADHLAVWEHKLDALVVLDAASRTAIGPLSARYPADQELDGATDSRLDLGGGAMLDVYAAESQPVTATTPPPPVSADRSYAASVSLTLENVWLPIVGQPPSPPPRDLSRQSALAGTRPRVGVALISDGLEVWATTAGS